MDAQRAKIEAWCQLNDCPLSEMFVDAGLSGGRADNRPGLQSALEAVSRKGGVLIVYSLSRLSRSTRDTLALSDRLAKAGADLVSLSEKIDTTSASGKMVFRLLAVLAEFERDQVSERTKTAMSHLRRQGKRVSRFLPYGSGLAADGVSLRADPSEAVVADRIVSLRRDGVSFGAIGRKLDGEGIRSKCGGRWHPKTVRDVYLRSAVV